MEEIPNGDGGFIALATGCFLYERYAKAVINKSGEKADSSSLAKQFSRDFNTSEQTAKEFWDVVRNGILHQGMPKQSNQGKNNLPGYILHHSFPFPVALIDWGGECVLTIQPWSFVWRVIELCQENIELVMDNNSFPFPKVM